MKKTLLSFLGRKLFRSTDVSEGPLAEGSLRPEGGEGKGGKPLGASSNDTPAGPENTCECMCVSRERIETLIQQGVKSLVAISNETGACTGCSMCRSRILEMLGQNDWMKVDMVKAVCHNDTLASYILKPEAGQFASYTPGQHIVVQYRIYENWCESSFCILGKCNGDSLKVAVCKQPADELSGWLFDAAPDKVSVFASQPQGSFLLNKGTSPLLCIAEGYGIMPFTAFALKLKEEGKSRPMHLMYSAPKTYGCTLPGELRSIMEGCPVSQLDLWAENKQSNDFREKVANAVKSLTDPDIYVSGSEEFQNIIGSALENLISDKSKVHLNCS